MRSLTAPSIPPSYHVIIRWYTLVTWSDSKNKQNHFWGPLDQTCHSNVECLCQKLHFSLWTLGRGWHYFWHHLCNNPKHIQYVTSFKYLRSGSSTFVHHNLFFQIIEDNSRKNSTDLIFRRNNPPRYRKNVSNTDNFTIFSIFVPFYNFTGVYNTSLMQYHLLLRWTNQIRLLIKDNDRSITTFFKSE